MADEKATRPLPVARPRRYRWVAGSVVAVVLFTLTFGPTTLALAIPFEAYNTGWPAVCLVETRSIEPSPDGSGLVPYVGRSWLTAGIVLNLAWSVAASALVVALCDALLDRRFSIQTLLWLTLLAAVLLCLLGATFRHNAEYTF